MNIAFNCVLIIFLCEVCTYKSMDSHTGALDIYIYISTIYFSCFFLFYFSFIATWKNVVLVQYDSVSAWSVWCVAVCSNWRRCIECVNVCRRCQYARLNSGIIVIVGLRYWAVNARTHQMQPIASVNDCCKNEIMLDWLDMIWSVCFVCMFLFLLCFAT